MSHLTTIVKKEIKELLTPGSVASVVIMVIMFACLGGIIGDEVSKSTVMPAIGIANSDEQTIELEDREWDAYKFLKKFYVNSGDKRITPGNVDQYVIKIDGRDVYSEMEASGLGVALVLSDDFKKNIEESMAAHTTGGPYKQGEVDQYFTYAPTSGMIEGTISSTVITAVVTYMNSDLSKFLVGSDEADFINFVKDPISGSGVYTYVNGELYKDVTPAQISESMTGQTLFIPIIIMIIIMMIGSIVISSMGSEKENKTLETLLTMPIKRSTLVTGKIIAAAVVGLVFGLAYMVGMGIYIGSVTYMTIGGTGIDLDTLGLSLGITDYILIGVSMFLAIACALGICMILGAFAKNYKSAQTMTMPLSILAIIPMFITMFSGWYGSNILIKGILFAIPFSHPMMATQALLNGDMALVLGGMAYMAVFAVISIVITVKLYDSDILITGLSQNKYVEKFRGNRKRR